MARVLEIVKYRLSGSVITFVNFVSIEDFEGILDVWSSEGVIVSKDPASVDPSPPDANDNVQQQLYELVTKNKAYLSFYSSYSGGCCLPSHDRGGVEKYSGSHCYCSGYSGFPWRHTKQINIPPKSRDTRVLCIMLLLGRYAL